MPRKPIPRYPNPSSAQASPRELDRRVETRLPSGHMAFVRFPSEPDAPNELVIVWDVSRQGIGLFLTRPVEIGMVLELTFRKVPVRDQVATVMHCTAKEQGWMVGCELKQLLTEDEWRALQV